MNVRSMAIIGVILAFLLGIYALMHFGNGKTPSLGGDNQTQELTLNTAQISLPDANAPPPRAVPGPAPGTSFTPSPPVE